MMIKSQFYTLALIVFVAIFMTPSKTQIVFNGNLDNFNSLYQHFANVTLNSILTDTEIKTDIHLWSLLWGLYSNYLQSVKILKIDYDKTASSKTSIDYNQKKQLSFQVQNANIDLQLNIYSKKWWLFSTIETAKLTLVDVNTKFVVSLLQQEIAEQTIRNILHEHVKFQTKSFQLSAKNYTNASSESASLNSNISVIGPIFLEFFNNAAVTFFEEIRSQLINKSNLHNIILEINKIGINISPINMPQFNIATRQFTSVINGTFSHNEQQFEYQDQQEISNSGPYYLTEVTQSVGYNSILISRNALQSLIKAQISKYQPIFTVKMSSSKNIDELSSQIRYDYGDQSQIQVSINIPDLPQITLSKNMWRTSIATLQVLVRQENLNSRIPNDWNNLIRLKIRCSFEFDLSIQGYIKIIPYMNINILDYQILFIDPKYSPLITYQKYNKFVEVLLQHTKEILVNDFRGRVDLIPDFSSFDLITLNDFQNYILFRFKS